MCCICAPGPTTHLGAQRVDQLEEDELASLKVLSQHLVERALVVEMLVYEIAQVLHW